MNTIYKHFHIIPTVFCERVCPYCINSSKEFKVMDFGFFTSFVDSIKTLNSISDKKIIFEFNGGEFTLVPSINNFFEEIVKRDIILDELILTTHFHTDNSKYVEILNILNNKYNIRFFVSFHYDCTDSFLNKIEDFLKNTKDFDFVFDINLINGLNLIEDNFNKYLDRINSLAKKYKKIRIVNSEYIQKSNINRGKTFNLLKEKKLCKGGVYYVMNKRISHACSSGSSSVGSTISLDEIASNSFQEETIICNKICPNQWYNIEKMEPKPLNFKK